MDILFTYQNELLEQTDDRFFRAMFHQLDWGQRMFGITGLRGVGKTTMLLQFLKYHAEEKEQALYVSADHPWFFEHSLHHLANQFTKYGGKLLLIDEIHKSEHWSRELKTMYDGHPELQIIFTASSMFDILKGEADLSRRTVTYELTGLSFREYLQLFHDEELPQYTLSEILDAPAEAASRVTSHIKPLPLFRTYLENGYFPFAAPEQKRNFHQKLSQVINTVLESDLQLMEGYSAANTFKIKRLLGVIAESAPFEPNISKIAQKLHLGRDTVKIYLQNLQKARILNLISRKSKGTAALQKPDKIYLENTNLSFTLRNRPETGNIRETFFLNQLRNAGHTVQLSKQSDFIVDGEWIFEIGGPSKEDDQIKKLENAWLALDDLEHAFLNRIPLWLFGFLY